MGPQEIKSVEHLEKLAKSLYSNGFDYTYINRRLHSLSDDSQLTKQIIEQLKGDRITQEARAITMSERMDIGGRDSYLGLFVGVFLVLFGFLIKAFVAMANVVTIFPYIIMVFGMVIAFRHFVK